MAQRAALLIAVEEFFELAPTVPYAGVDGTALKMALLGAGYTDEKCILLAGKRTTKASIESFLARLPRLVGTVDSLLVAFISRAFSVKARGYLACIDTIQPDLPGTALALSELLSALKKVRTKQITVLLDVDPLQVEGEKITPGLDAAELGAFDLDSTPTTLLLASEPGSRSFESAQLRHGIWRHHLIEAFKGSARSAISPDGTMTVAALQAYLEDAVPRSLRLSYESAQEQTPRLFGAANASGGIADLSRTVAARRDVLDPTRMKRVVFRAETPGRIKELSGFRKSHSLPDRANEWARKYVNRIAAIDLKADLDTVFDMIREQFSYKRKDVEVSHERDGAGIIRTPEFEYEVSIDVNRDDPTQLIWKRELGRITEPEFVRSQGFRDVFGSRFDRLAFEFEEEINVAAFIDRLEEDPPAGARMLVGSDSDRAEIMLAGFAGKIQVTSDAVIIFGQAGQAETLLEQFLAFLNKFEGLSDLRALPG